MFGLINKLSNMKSVSILLIIFLFSMFMMRNAIATLKEITGGIGILDLHFSYTIQEIYETLFLQGVEGRSYYLSTFFIIDFIYPLTYAFFYSVVISYFFKVLKIKNKIVNFFIILPFIGMSFDYLENLFLSIILMKYPTKLYYLGLISSYSTKLKFLCVYLSLLIAILLFLVILFKKIKISHKF